MHAIKRNRCTSLFLVVRCLKTLPEKLIENHLFTNVSSISGFVPQSVPNRKKRSGTLPEESRNIIFGQNLNFTPIWASSRLLTISLPNAIFVMILRKPCIFLIKTALLRRFPRILGPLGRPNWILDL